MLAATITVPTAAKASLYDLLTPKYARPQEGFAQIRFQAITGTQIVYIGDQAVSVTNYGAAIPATANSFIELGHDNTEFNTRTMYLIAAAADQTVAVFIK